MLPLLVAISNLWYRYQHAPIPSLTFLIHYFPTGIILELIYSLVITNLSHFQFWPQSGKIVRLIKIWDYITEKIHLLLWSKFKTNQSVWQLCEHILNRIGKDYHFGRYANNFRTKLMNLPVGQYCQHFSNQTGRICLFDTFTKTFRIDFAEFDILTSLPTNFRTFEQNWSKLNL